MDLASHRYLPREEGRASLNVDKRANHPTCQYKRKHKPIQEQEQEQEQSQEQEHEQEQARKSNFIFNVFAITRFYTPHDRGVVIAGVTPAM